MFKDTVKSLNGVNRAWEESYNAQSDDIVTHGMEISRLQAEVSGLKQAMAANQQRNLTVQTPQGDRPFYMVPGTM